MDRTSAAAWVLQTELTATGARYRLPRRQLGRIRHFGWAAAGGGLLGTAFMVSWMGMPVMHGIQLLIRQEWFGLALLGFGALGLFGLLPCLGLLLGGLTFALNWSRCVVEVRADRVYSNERLLFWTWRRKFPSGDIRKLRLISAESDSDAANCPPDWLGAFDHALMVNEGGAQKFAIAPAYPAHLLGQLGRELAPRLGAEFVPLAGDSQHSAGFAALSEPEACPGIGEPSKPGAERPAEAVSTIERRPDGVTISVPPVGVVKGSHGLFAFGVLWSGFVGLVVVAAVLAALGVLPVDGDPPSWGTMLILLPFVAVGFGMLLAAINMGKRRAELVTAHGRLLVIRHSIFSTRQQEHAASSIEEIVVGPSGMEINECPVNELQIHLSNGNKLGLLSQLNDGELNWIASQLNQTLPVGTDVGKDANDPGSPQNDLAAPSVSTITMQRSAHDLTVVVPPRGLVRSLGSILVGLLFFAAGAGVATWVGWDHLRNGFQWDDLFTLMFICVWTLVFAGGGLAIALYGLITGLRRFHIRADRNELQVVRQGLFGRGTFAWRSDELASVAVVDSGTKVNNRTLYQLRIQPHTGNSLGIMTGHNRSDQTRVAAAIGETLGLSV